MKSSSLSAEYGDVCGGLHESAQTSERLPYREYCQRTIG